MWTHKTVWSVSPAPGVVADAENTMECLFWGTWIEWGDSVLTSHLGVELCDRAAIEAGAKDHGRQELRVWDCATGSWCQPLSRAKDN